jgi:hypothetical protein
MAKRDKANSEQKPNAYYIAFFTALLSGGFSVVGSYYTSSYQANMAITQKQFEYKSQAYSAFLEKLNKSNSPQIHKIYTLSKSVELASTDMENEMLDQNLDLLGVDEFEEVYDQFDNSFNLLRIYGSKDVNIICDDILNVISGRLSQLDLDKYKGEAKSRLVSLINWRIEDDLGLALEARKKLNLLIVLLRNLMTEMRKDMNL